MSVNYDLYTRTKQTGTEIYRRAAHVFRRNFTLEMDHKINKRLLFVKAHYFFFFAAISCLMPFLPVYILELGLSKSALSVIYLVLPMSVIAAKPFFGNLADCLVCHKSVFVASLVAVTATYFGIAFVPNLKYHDVRDPNITRGPSFNDTLSFPSSLELCASPIPDRCKKDGSNLSCLLSCDGGLREKISLHVEYSNDSRDDTFCAIIRKWNDSFISTYNSSTECNATNCKCIDPSPRIEDFWLLFICMVLSYVSVGVAVSMGDMIAFQLSVEENSQYGYQRVWGSVGWGLLALIVSNVLQATGLGQSSSGINPIFFIFLSMCLIDIVTVSKLQIGVLPKPVHALSNLWAVFSDPLVFLFTLAVFVVGFMTGALWTYQFVYVAELGGPPVLFGLIIAVQCFLGEIPFLLLSGRILKWMGHTRAILVCMSGFAVRFIGYSIITDPWTILPLELSNGVCLGLFFAALVSFASENAPPGMAATMQGIQQSVFEGFGVGVGNLVSGLVYDAKGGRRMYFYLGAGTAIFCIVYQTAVCAFNRLKLGAGRPRPPQEDSVMSTFDKIDAQPQLSQG